MAKRRIDAPKMWSAEHADGTLFDWVAVKKVDATQRLVPYNHYGVRPCRVRIIRQRDYDYLLKCKRQVEALEEAK